LGAFLALGFCDGEGESEVRKKRGEGTRGN
jgi:hypothetical protein